MDFDEKQNQTMPNEKSWDKIGNLVLVNLKKGNFDNYCR
jgi:hypothetical protein